MKQLRDMCESTADFIRGRIQADATFAGGAEVAVLVEDKLDSSFSIDEMLGRNNLAVIVGLTGFSRRQQSGALVFGTATFDVSVFENPMINRETDGTPTAQMLGEFLINAMHWAKPEGFLTPLRFQNFTRADMGQWVVVRQNWISDVQLFGG